MDDKELVKIIINPYEIKRCCLKCNSVLISTNKGRACWVCGEVYND